jgi:PUA domain protein
MKQITLSKKEIKKINLQIKDNYNVENLLPRDSFVILAEDKYLLIHDELFLFYKDDLLLPSLRILLKNNFLKKITVNIGAVPFVIKGADIMRPGITKIEPNIEKNDIISIIDEKNLKPIALGRALFSSDELQKMETGRVILNCILWVMKSGSLPLRKGKKQKIFK